jgi:hypothetical protein
VNSPAPVGVANRVPQGDASSWGWIRIAFWICIVIAVAVVIRRTLAIAYPPRSVPAQMAALDAAFASHAGLTLAHILPAMLFVLLLPFAYSRRFAGARWLELLLFGLGIVVGITAYAMSRFAIGGWVERSAVLVFNSLFLVSLIRAWRFRSGDRVLLLRWLTRAVAILLGIATTRPVMGVFFATSRLTHLTPPQFFGIAFWIGFSINTLAIELWLRSRQADIRISTLATANPA